MDEESLKIIEKNLSIISSFYVQSLDEKGLIQFLNSLSYYTREKMKNIMSSEI